MSAYTTLNAVRLAANPDWQNNDPAPAQAGPARDASALPDPQITDAIAQASSMIDQAISARYATPVQPVDPQADPLVYPDQAVAYWARDIALYFATLTFYRHMPLANTDPVYLRMVSAVASLNAVRDGKTSLNLPAADVAGGSGFSGVADSGYGSDLFDGADAGYHRSWIHDWSAGRTPWAEGGYLYG